MIRKTDLVREALEQGDLSAALKLAKDFKLGLSKDERAQLGRGWECLTRPDFYRQLGKSPEREIELAKAVLQKWA